MAKKKLPKIFKKKEVAEKIKTLCNDNNIISLGVFGSYARGEQTPKSDIDLLVTFEKGKEKGLLGLVQLQNRFQQVFRKKTDMLTSGGVSPYLRENILNDLKVLYEKR